MTDRADLLEAALDCLPDGIAVVGAEGQIAFWNRAAEAITGYAGADLLARPVPGALDPLMPVELQASETEAAAGAQASRRVLVHLQHKLGYDVPAMMRILVLRDGLGGRIGTAAVFHPADSLDALPHGDCIEGSTAESSQAKFEERLNTVFEDFGRGADSFGVLWVTVDQAHDLRKTHGASACEAMLAKVERTLANGLRPAEEIGRWGEDEFLVISNERTPEMLAAHSQVLAGLARTADFRWWGDRVSLTVSIGAAQAELGEGLNQMLERAQAAMLWSVHAGGNHITLAPGRHTCLPS
jgi:diguanylate cyclase (GGDEF)-like protein/PAS domain S-box-containing protein